MPRASSPRPVARRWVVTTHDISDQIEGSPSAYLGLIYDPGDDRILAASVEESPEGSVALAFEDINSGSRLRPHTLACHRSVLNAARLQCGRFSPPPDVIVANESDLRANAAVFRHFLDNANPAAMHDAAVRALEEPARRFIDSRCWDERADNQPILLDASINGARAGGIVSVMGNGGETWGISIFPDGLAFNEMMVGDASSMPRDGMISCVIAPQAIHGAAPAAVEMALAIEGGHAVPALAHQVQLLHTALVAATQTPVGVAEPSIGAVATPEFDATFTAFDIEAAEAARKAASSARSSRGTPSTPTLRFGELPRSVGEQLLFPDDGLAWECLSSLPPRSGLPAVFVGCGRVSDAEDLATRITSGDYLGITAIAGIGGTTIRLIGLSDPLVLGTVGTLWPPLRGFMRRRERSGGLHAVVLATKDPGTPVGIFMCVLPQGSGDDLQSKVKDRHTSASGKRVRPTKRRR
ncbi:MAG: hypothetical protein DLM65_02820 [Candidatus Aeolococcus gillhamiae]|uniref:Uncharacterized protein n=1 Tax=Candidatus Aeolococcus gillhamiae TaxID=3127015 RepID=A0A2W5ZC93_9BACT|nr:MAG: hypothetical protein DLM65_02820 [Candidatus Dormibacter sp. RRmetagenome_bin12]